MQQLTAATLARSWEVHGEALLIRAPLPESVASTHQWVRQFCALTGARLGEQEWGADRYQATLYCGPYTLLLCIEWLCDAIWIERYAGESRPLTEIVRYLQSYGS